MLLGSCVDVCILYSMVYYKYVLATVMVHSNFAVSLLICAVHAQTGIACTRFLAWRVCMLVVHLPDIHKRTFW